MRTAEVIAHGRDNNFNLIRMLAASIVIVSHSFALALGPGADNLAAMAWLLPLGLGSASVRVFFGISGFFILKSFDQRESIYAFAMARISRIVPALLIVVSVTTIAAAMGLSFARNPTPGLMNGSTWTIRYEVICYAVLALAGLCGMFRNGRFPAFVLVYAIVYLSIEEMIVPLPEPLASLSLPFVIGMAIYQYRHLVPINGTIAALSVAVAYICHLDAVWSFALTYCAFWIGAGFPFLRAYNRLGDYSYGTYIFAWPIQQALALLVVGISPGQMMAIALPVTWALGALSWHFVEQPTMRLAKQSLSLAPWGSPVASTIP